MEPEREGHPVLTGLIALIAVGLVVGVLVSGGALAATRVLGLSGGDAETDSSSRQSMYIPLPSPTEDPTGAEITLAPGETTPAAPTTSATPEFQITLSAGETAVGQMERIDLSGVYPTGEGRIVQVQRFEDNQWVDFSTVDATVSNATFSTYVLTSRSGVNQFRVRDTENPAAVSNEVDVQVG